MTKPSQVTVDRAVDILREARELARRGEPILLDVQDVRALIAVSLAPVRDALKGTR